MSFGKAIVVTVLVASAAGAQGHDHGAMTQSSNVGLHMEMSPVRAPLPGDSARAAAIAAELRAELAKYRDTSAAVADGYRMFLPNVKEQKVYHFTNNWHALQEAFRFDARKPTSLLYRKDTGGRLVLVGAMYTAPKRWGADKLDARVPLSVARWHKHVNWCLPPKGEAARWLEKGKDGQPLFGPESAIASKAACDSVGGNFVGNLFGWMVHANVMEGDDPAVVWGDEHAGHDMSAGMKTGVTP